MSSWKNLSEDKFNELLSYSKQIFREKFKSIEYITFVSAIENRFGKDIGFPIIDLLWKRVHEDIKLNQLFGFDYDMLEKEIDEKILLSDKVAAINNELNKIENIINVLDLFNQQYKRIIIDERIPKDMPDDKEFIDYILEQINDDFLNEIIEFVTKQMLNEHMDEMDCVEMIRRDFISYKESLQQLIRQTKLNESETYPLFNFDFEKVREYANKLEVDKAILYYEYVLKEFDRERRENYFLYMTDDDIKYFSEEIMKPPDEFGGVDLRLAGIGATKESKIKNFAININNEIKFITRHKNLYTQTQKENISTDTELNNEYDTKYEKFKDLCKLKKLVIGRTIPNPVLYAIAKESGIEVGKPEEFKAGNKGYHQAREYASRAKYKRKKSSGE